MSKSLQEQELNREVLFGWPPEGSVARWGVGEADGTTGRPTFAATILQRN